MSQSIKYQSTDINPAKSVSQIGELVRRYGGSRFEQLWSEEGEITGIRFSIRHKQIGELPVYMTARTGEIERILTASGYAVGRSFEQQEERPRKVAAQARRISWRHLKDLTEQLLLAVELGLRSLPSAFMSDVEVWDETRNETVTMYELFERRAQIANSGRGVELTASRSSVGSGNPIELPPVEAK